MANPNLRVVLFQLLNLLGSDGAVLTNRLLAGPRTAAPAPAVVVGPRRRALEAGRNMAKDKEGNKGRGRGRERERERERDGWERMGWD